MVGYVISLFKQMFNNDGLRKSVWTEDLNKDDFVEKVDLNKKTKKQLEEYGRSLGIELDRRHTKKKLIETLENCT
tara:strand:- start:331 stop:555 length:225 start_codon:yes stop_codon:yes gene_type:complete